jgi:SAM-dependent methyltransferase
MAEVYQHPRYYEIAFSWRDISAEVDVFEAVIQRYSRIPAMRMPELGCGPAPHLAELARRGYTYIGLDLSRPMLTYARQAAHALQVSATFHESSMLDFRLDEPVDFAFVLLGSLFAANTSELRSHFDAVAQALKPGGLYLLDWCVQFALPAERTESWEMVEDGVTVNTTYHQTPINAVDQTVEERLTIEAEDAGTSVTLQDVVIRREIYPQEFLLMIAGHQDFEFVGWWNNWDLTAPLDGTHPINRPIAVVRRV